MSEYEKLIEQIKKNQTDHRYEDNFMVRDDDDPYSVDWSDYDDDYYDDYYDDYCNHNDYYDYEVDNYSYADDMSDSDEYDYEVDSS
ncbi:unnamed protein product [Cochlearia groenlandica]